MTLNAILNEIRPTKETKVNLTKSNPNLSIIGERNSFGSKQLIEICREVSNVTKFQTLNEVQNSR